MGRRSRIEHVSLHGRVIGCLAFFARDERYRTSALPTAPGFDTREEAVRHLEQIAEVA